MSLNEFSARAGAQTIASFEAEREVVVKEAIPPQSLLKEELMTIARYRPIRFKWTIFFGQAGYKLAGAVLETLDWT